MGQQPGGEFTPALSTTRAGDAAVQAMKKLQQFASVHATFHNHFNQERHLVSREIYKERRSAALAKWRTVAS